MRLCSAAVLASAAFALAHAFTRPNHSCSVDVFTHRSPGVNILNATYYAEASLNVSGTFNDIAFCEVYAAVSYGNNDTLVFATWLPDEVHYKDRFMAVGNGGMAGVIDYTGMLTQLNSGLGFTVAGGNAGHLASENNDGEGAPGMYIPYLHDKSQVTAWIHDAISLFTPAATTLTTVYYHTEPKYKYYSGCSTGGAQGFALAQFHPTLFDGIYAGCPGNWYSHLALSFLWNAQQTDTTDRYLDQTELNFTTNAILDACDKIDGVTDRLLENPLECRFNLTSLACENIDSAANTSEITCLSPGKLSAAEAIYAGPKRSDTGQQLYPGFTFGSEIEWTTQEGPLAGSFTIPILQNLVYGDLQYDSRDFDWGSDVDTLDEKAGTLIDEISPDLSRFREHGGKMLTSQGWADPYNAATWPIEHLHQLQDFFGGSVEDFFNLFVVPGGGHCGAATHYPWVPATHNIIPALVEWVENGTRPIEILSTDPPDGSDRTRKLCAWPKTAEYVSGNVDDWRNYVCR